MNGSIPLSIAGFASTTCATTAGMKIASALACKDRPLAMLAHKLCEADTYTTTTIIATATFTFASSRSAEHDVPYGMAARKYCLSAIIHCRLRSRPHRPPRLCQ